MDFSPYMLPLLTKGLIEQAAQQRTYVIRTAFALVMSLYGLRLYEAWIQSGMSNLGQGPQFLSELLWIQSWVTIAIVPLLACGSIAGEKEHDTLELLLISKLSPGVIIIEKWVTHCVTIGSFQVLTLPLMVISYLLGGVTIPLLLYAIIFMVGITSVAVAWAVLCSAWAYTTRDAFLAYITVIPFGLGVVISGTTWWPLYGAFLALYACVLGTILLIVLAPLSEYIPEIPELPEGEVETDPIKVFWQQRSKRPNRASYFAAFVPVLFWIAFGMMALGAYLYQFVPNLVMSIVVISGALALSVPALAAATGFLLMRPRLPAGRRTVDALDAIDTALAEVNDLMAHGGVVFASGAEGLPSDKPVRWLELRRRIWTLRSLIWFGLAVNVALVLIYFTMMPPFGNEWGPVGLVLVDVALWLFFTLTIAVLACGLFSADRSRQTLEILLTTTMSSREILDQKLSGIRRIVALSFFVLMSFSVLNVVWRTTDAPSWTITLQKVGSEIPSLLVRLLTLAVYLPGIAWLGTWFGLRGRTPVAAVAACVGTLIAVCILPLILALPLEGTSREVLNSLSPIVMLAIGSPGTDQWRTDLESLIGPLQQTLWPWSGLVHLTLFGTSLWWLRRRTRDQFTYLIGRTDPARPDITPSPNSTPWWKRLWKLAVS